MQLCSLDQTKVKRAVRSGGPQPLHSGAALKMNLLWLYMAMYFGFLKLDLQIPRQDLMTLDLPYHYGLSWEPLDQILTLMLWFDFSAWYQNCPIVMDLSADVEY